MIRMTSRLCSSVRVGHASMILTKSDPIAAPTAARTSAVIAKALGAHPVTPFASTPAGGIRWDWGVFHVCAQIVAHAQQLYGTRYRFSIRVRSMHSRVGGASGYHAVMAWRLGSLDEHSVAPSRCCHRADVVSRLGVCTGRDPDRWECAPDSA